MSDFCKVPEKFQWFRDAKYGVFIHWGPYARYERGEQVLFREHLNQREYEENARQWNPKNFDADAWADVFARAGFQYACLTTRHHDGYCLWNTKTTDYNSMVQTAGRDLVREYTEAVRKRGLRVGLYYSWCDWRQPAYYEGPGKNPEGFEKVKRMIWEQLDELMTNYGKIDYLFFDGTWPRYGDEIGTEEIVAHIRTLQPDILINNRLGFRGNQEEIDKFGGLEDEGDFGTPEQNVFPQDRMWESCQTSTWRWWGYTKNERYKSSDEILKLLCESVSKGGNMILNVGPKPDGTLPEEFTERALAVGKWLNTYGEAIYGTDGGDLTEFATCGYQTMKGKNLYLIFSIWNCSPVLRLPDMTSRAAEAVLMGRKERLTVEQKGTTLYIDGLPEDAGEPLFPVIKIQFAERPGTTSWGKERQWQGDPMRIARWARGEETGNF